MEGFDTKTIIGIGLCVVLCAGVGWSYKKGSSAESECEMLKKAMEDFGNIISQQDQHIKMLNARISQLEAMLGQPPNPTTVPSPQTRIPQPGRFKPQPPQQPKHKPKPKPQPEPPQVEEVEDDVEEPGDEFDDQLRSELEGGEVCDVNGDCKKKKGK